MNEINSDSENLKFLNNILSGLATYYSDDSFLYYLKKTVSNYPHDINPDFLSFGQIKSKKWLVQELINLNLDLGITYIVAGWYGLHARLIDNSELKYKIIRLFDKDQTAVKISNSMHRDLVMNAWKFKAIKKDLFDINYLVHNYEIQNLLGKSISITERPNTIINTSCEHIDFVKWLELIPVGTLLVLQTNNFVAESSHINCSLSLDNFIASINLSKLLYSGTLKFESYERYMVIGNK